jgi:bifunctional NMN adenylyltransferase/nudix hydrolase
MKQASKQYDVGALVGRFQVHELHQAHIDLIQHVCDEHDKVIVFLGLSPLSNSANNPLDFQSRKQMLLDRWPNLNVLYVKDMPSDKVWSKRLDDQISDLVAPSQSVVLYGGRESFAAHYEGKHEVIELADSAGVEYSGSAVRRMIARGSTFATPDWRAGAIWASANRYPTCFPTVDVAILKGDECLFGRKPNEAKYRFIGGFADPRSESYEADAKREVAEETGLSVEDVKYIGSTLIDDWRYRNEPDKIKTLMFKATYQFGAAKPNDDIEETRWLPLTVNALQIVPEHRPLLAMLKENL